MPEADAEKTWYNPFDLTKVWPHSDYPLIEVGEMELNRNPENYFAEIESSAFSPNAIVPGIGFSPDKMLQARIQSYPDAHRYRLGLELPALRRSTRRSARSPTTSATGSPPGCGPTTTAAAPPTTSPTASEGRSRPSEFREPPMTLSCAVVDRFDASEGNDNFRQAGDLYPPDGCRRTPKSG